MTKVRMFVIAFAICLLACVDKAEANTANSCLHKNPFIKSLASPGVTQVEIYAEPKTGKFKYCSSEWNPYGSCCNPEDLVIAVSFDNFIIQKNRDLLFDKAYMVQRSMEFSIQAFSSRSFQLTKSHRYLLKVTADIIKEINLEPYKKLSDRCWDHMAKIRNSALCSTCSGRSEMFFSKDKILISADACREIVDSCQPYFAHLEHIYALVKSKRTTIEETVLALKPSSLIKSAIDKFFKFSPPVQLWEALSDYVKHRSDEQRSGLHSAKVCSMIASINKLPSLVALEDQDSYFLKKLSKEKASMKHKQSMNDAAENHNKAQKDEDQLYEQKVAQAREEMIKNIAAANQDSSKTESEKRAILRIHQSAFEAAKLKAGKEKHENNARIKKNYSSKWDKTNLAYKESEKASEKVTIKSLSNWQESALAYIGNRQLERKKEMDIDPEDFRASFKSDCFVFLKKPAIDMAADFIAPGVMWDDGSGRHAAANLSLKFP